MPIISAEKARTVQARTEAYKETVLSQFSHEIHNQAQKGLNWAHLVFDPKTPDEFIKSIVDELVIAGYQVPEPNGSVIHVTW